MIPGHECFLQVCFPFSNLPELEPVVEIHLDPANDTCLSIPCTFSDVCLGNSIAQNMSWYQDLAARFTHDYVTDAIWTAAFKVKQIVKVITCSKVFLKGVL